MTDRAAWARKRRLASVRRAESAVYRAIHLMIREYPSAGTAALRATERLARLARQGPGR